MTLQVTGDLQPASSHPNDADQTLSIHNSFAAANSQYWPDSNCRDSLTRTLGVSCAVPGERAHKRVPEEGHQIDGTMHANVSGPVGSRFHHIQILDLKAALARNRLRAPAPALAAEALAGEFRLANATVPGRQSDDCRETCR